MFLTNWTTFLDHYTPKTSTNKPEYTHELIHRNRTGKLDVKGKIQRLDRQINEKSLHYGENSRYKLPPNTDQEPDVNSF